MSDHSGYFCEGCLTKQLIFPKTCDVCSSKLSDYLNQLYGELHDTYTGVYDVATRHNDGETLIITTLYQQGLLTNDYEYYRRRGIWVMRNTAQIKNTVEYHEALDFNLSIWKTPILTGLTRNFCEPLAVLARSGVITVTIARLILLMVGSCLRNKTEVLCLLDLVVYPEDTDENEMKYN